MLNLSRASVSSLLNAICAFRYKKIEIYTKVDIQMSSSEERLNELVRQCKTTAKLARYTGRILSEHSSKQRFIQHMIRGVNFFIGAIVAVYSLLSLKAPGQQFSHQGAVVATLVAAAALLLDAALPTIMAEPNPDRFKDYAYYIDECARELLKLAEKPEFTPTWEARAEVHINSARLNIDDVFRTFTWVRKKLETGGQYFEYWDDIAAPPK